MAQQKNKRKGIEIKNVHGSDYPSSQEYSDSTSRSYDDPNEPPCPRTQDKHDNDDKNNKDNDNDLKNNDYNDTGDIQGDIDDNDGYIFYYFDDGNNNGGNYIEKNKHGEGSCEAMEYKKLVKNNKILRKRIKIMELKEEKSKLMLKIAAIDKEIELEKLKLKFMI